MIFQSKLLVYQRVTEQQETMQAANTESFINKKGGTKNNTNFILGISGDVVSFAHLQDSLVLHGYLCYHTIPPLFVSPTKQSSAGFAMIIVQSKLLNYQSVRSSKPRKDRTRNPTKIVMVYFFSYPFGGCYICIFRHDLCLCWLTSFASFGVFISHSRHQQPGRPLKCWLWQQWKGNSHHTRRSYWGKYKEAWGEYWILPHKWRFS